MQEKRVHDYWNVDSNKHFVRFVERVHEIYSVEGEASKRTYVVGVRLTIVQTTTRPDYVCPEVWTKIGEAAQNWEKRERKNEKPKLDNARRRRGICFIDLDDQDYEETLKNSRIKLERLMAPAVPCKKKAQTGTTKVVAKQEIASQKIFKTTYGCTVESHESTRQRVESSQPQQITKTTLQAKDLLRWHITIWFTNLFICSKQGRFRMQEPQWTRNGKSSRQPQHGNRHGKTSRVRRRLFWKHKETKKSPHCHIAGHMSPHKMRSWNQHFNSTKVESCSVVTLWKTTLKPMQYSLNRARPRPKWLPKKSNGCHCKITRLWRTSSWCSICLHSSKVGGRSQIAWNS